MAELYSLFQPAVLGKDVRDVQIVYGTQYLSLTSFPHNCGASGNSLKGIFPHGELSGGEKRTVPKWISYAYPRSPRMGKSEISLVTLIPRYNTVPVTVLLQ